jgi:hypothetical protein
LVFILTRRHAVHNQVAFMAEKFLDKHTTNILARILEPQYNGSIGRAAAWADAYAHTTEGRFSYQWHWIDSSDNVGITDLLSRRLLIVTASQTMQHVLQPRLH